MTLPMNPDTDVSSNTYAIDYNREMRKVNNFFRKNEKLVTKVWLCGINVYYGVRSWKEK